MYFQIERALTDASVLLNKLQSNNRSLSLAVYIQIYTIGENRTKKIVSYIANKDRHLMSNSFALKPDK